ncbi:E3 ubiquitin-protein ligase RNF34-like [Amblyomma americanum]
MGAPAFMREFRELMNLHSDGGLFGSSHSRLGNCDSCLAKFGLLKRRHACDQCGTDFCASCVRGRRCPRCRALAGGRPALLALRARDLRALLHARGLAPPLGAREKAELVDLLLLGTAAGPEPGTARTGRPEWPDYEDWAERPGQAERPDWQEQPECRDLPEQPHRPPPAYVPPPQPQWGGPFPATEDPFPAADAPFSPAETPSEHAPEQPEPEPTSSSSSSSNGTGDGCTDAPPAAVPIELALEHFESVEELGQLSVLQMKLMLTRNFVDYRGCCEKAELHEKLSWLWNQKRKHRDDALGEEDLCKICMEGCVDCVILDCGHMCTCTGCGKQLSECPICRQYVVRVVHVFKA